MYEVLQNEAHTFMLTPDLGQRNPVSAEFSLYNSDGSAVVSDAAATVDDTEATVDVATSRTSVDVDTGEGAQFVVRREYLYRSAQWGAVRVRVESIDDDTLTFTHALPFDSAAGDTIHGLQVSYSLSSTYTGTRGRNWQTVWAITDDEAGVHKLGEAVHIVRMRFPDAVSAQSVAIYIAQVFNSLVGDWGPSDYLDVAAEASDEVRRLLQKDGRFPDLFGDPATFRAAGRTALKRALAERLLVPNAETSVEDYRDRLYAELCRQIAEGITDVSNPHDADDDGAVSVREVGPRSILGVW